MRVARRTPRRARPPSRPRPHHTEWCNTWPRNVQARAWRRDFVGGAADVSSGCFPRKPSACTRCEDGSERDGNIRNEDWRAVSWSVAGSSLKHNTRTALRERLVRGQGSHYVSDFRSLSLYIPRKSSAYYGIIRNCRIPVGEHRNILSLGAANHVVTTAFRAPSVAFHLLLSIQ